jgi:uncharacterized membrane protein YqiK
MQNEILLGVAALAVFTWVFFSFVKIIPNNRIGVLEKVFGSPLKGGIIALRGEAGFQPHVLRGGIHLFMPFQYRVHILPLVTIPQGKIGYVFARDGVPLAPQETLAAMPPNTTFSDTAGFLQNGGKQGPQRQILREGTYAINLAQFIVISEDQVYALRLNSDEDQRLAQAAEDIARRRGFQPVIITEDAVGVVTVHDGPALPPNEIVAPIKGDNPDDKITFHNNFQDTDAYARAGGYRGRQKQTLVEGTYFINRLFATVELIPKTQIEVGQVGVVVSYTGDIGGDQSGSDFKHGEMVAKGNRGVWDEPLMPGKYAFNTYAGKVILVPTTNFILKWQTNEAGSHKFDENLAEVQLITKDAFEPLLPLSVVVHIDYRKAPLVIQRFGDIKKLVDQTLDPMVAAYFKNIGQTRTLIQLIQDRSSIQQLASEEMKEKFAQYNLELQEVLIGTPTSSPGDKRIEDILTQLRARQIAQEQIETYAQQEKAAVKERELREAEAKAKQQTHLTESELAITVQTNEGKAQAQRALQQREQMATMAAAEANKNLKLAEAEAARMRLIAEAEAQRVRSLGEAEADKIARMGIAEALAVEEQVRAYGGPRFQLTQSVMNRFAEAIEKSGVDIVPKINMAGNAGHEGQGAASNNVFEALLALMLSDRIGEGLNVGPVPTGPGSGDPQKELLRNQIRQSIQSPPAPAAKPAAEQAPH